MSTPNNINTPKSRDIPIFQFYELLQVEYLSCKFRAKIYVYEKDRNFWQKVAQGKEEKIKAIQERNSLPSIFTDSYMLNHYERNFYKEFGPPNFTYRDEQQKQEQQKLDYIYYYRIGEKVRVSDVSLGVRTGEIVSYIYNQLLKIKFDDNNEVEDVNIKDCSRIL